MLLNINKLNKSFGVTPIVQDVTFNLQEGEKVALVGVNGAGKSTIFKMITGELTPDSGDITLSKDATLGYLAQTQDYTSNDTIYEVLLEAFADIIRISDEMLELEHTFSSLDEITLNKSLKKYDTLVEELRAKNGFEYKSRIKGVLNGLGFTADEYNRTFNSLSGGEKTRLLLGRLLLSNPDLLLLDEPTNHLDINSIEWLEDYIKTYKNSVLIISHDRFFLDNTVTKIVELENTFAKSYYGNFTDYSVQKEIDREIELAHYLNQQKEIQKQQEVIRTLKSYNREKSVKRARSREKLLSKMQVIDKPDNLPATLNFEITPSIKSGNDVLFIEDLTKGFDDYLFRNISFNVYREDKIALIGDNGVGKTTLIKMIMGDLQQDSGNIKLGTNVNIGYYDQEYSTLSTHKTIFEEIQDANPKLTNTEIRNVLASFVFVGDEVYKKIETLSGGEKGRVALAKIMLSKANFLILDEPTNHLDMFSKEILENAINTYTGTVLYISHDRYFINNTATKVIHLSKEGVTEYLGNYDYYLEHRQNFYTQTEVVEIISANKDDHQKQKQERSEKRKQEKLLKKTEQDISKTEEKIKHCDELLSQPDVYTNPQRAKEVFDTKSELELTLENLYILWDELL